jgi:hypothetical protein
MHHGEPTRASLRMVAIVPMAALLALSTPAPPAVAQTNASSRTTQEDSRASATALMRRGVAEYKRRAFEAARSSFARAWDLEQHPAIAANLADVELRLSLYRDAAEHWSFYLRNAPPERDRTEAVSALERCRKHVAELSVAAEEKAVVSLDGRTLGEAPLPAALWVDPGPHLVEARTVSGRLATQQVTVLAGEVKHIELVPMATPSADAQSFEQPEASRTGAIPVAQANAKAIVPEKSATSARVPVLVGGIALTAVALGVGVAYGLKAESASDDAASLTAKITEEAIAHGQEGLAESASACSVDHTAIAADCKELGVKVDSARGARSTATVAFVAAGILGAATVAAYLLWPRSDASSAASVGRIDVVPWNERGNGVRLQLSF